MARLLDLVRRHPVPAYVVLTYGLSWTFWIPMVVGGQIVTHGGSVSHFPGLLGPAVAAIILTAVAGGRAGLRDFTARLTRWRVPLRWYAMASVPLSVLLLVALLLAASGGDVPTLEDLADYTGLPALSLPLVLVLVVIVGGFGEEAGWRGFLTPELLKRRGRFVASLLVALVWFGWHAPLFGVVETYRTMGAAILPMLGIGLISGSIVLTWLYVGSGGSIVIAALFHSALNLASATTAGSGLAGILVWNVVLVWAILVAIGWMIAPVPRNRALQARLRDGLMIAFLRSPLGRLLGGMAVVSFVGRQSGRTLMTPVECASESDRLIIFVGHPERKQWWRNVQANPEVSVAVGGRTLAGRATVHAGDTADGETDLTTYIRQRRRVRRALGLSDAPEVDHGALARAAAQAVTVRIELASVDEGHRLGNFLGPRPGHQATAGPE